MPATASTCLLYTSLQFAFDSGEENNYLPHNYDANSVVYTGTHDNDTTCLLYTSSCV